MSIYVLFPLIILFAFIQGLSGQPFSGADIGGFAGNATPKLFGRWMGVGSLFPFCRGHSEACTTDHVPWAFGEEVSSSLPLLDIYLNSKLKFHVNMYHSEEERMKSEY